MQRLQKYQLTIVIVFVISQDFDDVIISGSCSEDQRWRSSFSGGVRISSGNGEEKPQVGRKPDVGGPLQQVLFTWGQSDEGGH